MAKARPGVMVERSKEMLGSIATMFDNEATADLVVVVGAQRFHLHKLLLLRSGVFRVMLGNPSWEDASKRELELNEDALCLAHMEDFFRYFYTGQVFLKEGNFIPLLVLANKYDLPDLEEACQEFGSELVYNGVEVAQVLEWYLMAERTNLRRLWAKCHTYLLLNISKVFKASVFLELTIEQLIGFLRESEMVVNAEVGLFLKVWKWLEHRSGGGGGGDPARMEEYLVRLLPHIKLCMMNYEHLSAVEKRLRKHWPDRDKFDQLFAAPLLDAYKYHAIPFRRRPKVAMGHLDVPRLYTDATSQNSCLCMLLPLSGEILGETFSGKIPVSLSTADQGNVKMWGGQVRQHAAGAELEMWLMGEKLSISCLVDITVLIHKQVSSDRLMEQLLHHRQTIEKRPVRHAPAPSHGGGTPVKFSVRLDSHMFEPDSPYLITYQRKKCCILNIFVRHLQPPGQEAGGSGGAAGGGGDGGGGGAGGQGGETSSGDEDEEVVVLGPCAVQPLMDTHVL